MKRLSDYFLVFAIGVFGLVSQTLLFRDFLTVYEGNELGIASFFFSWLLWVAVGALAGRRDGPIVHSLTRRFPLVTLGYAVAYLLQAVLIHRSRTLAGVESYEAFSFAQMLPVSLLVNAPVSFCTGLFFTLACRWFSGAHAVAVARVYIVESAGSFVGGTLATLLLARGLSPEFVIVCAAALLICAAGLQLASRGSKIGWLLVLLAPGLVVCRVDRPWTRAGELSAWRRFFPAETYGGSFLTPQGRYLYGEYQNQFSVIAWESIVESLPNTEHASQVIALHLAQQPEARRFLVIGPGAYSLCLRLLALPQLEAVTWLDPDPAYAARLLAAVPGRFRPAGDRLRIPAVDPRTYLQTTQERYDAVVLNLPDVATLAMNRYVTGEFLALLRERLSSAGILGVRVSGGENFMGDELVNSGASVYRALTALFGAVIIKPGGESWLIASDGAALSEKPAELRDRFATVSGASEIYPPAGLLSLYLPDRADFQRAAYAKAVESVPAALLANSDRHPKALLHGLLLAARQTGASVTLSRQLRTFAQCGLPIVMGGVVLFALLRVVYVRRGGGQRTEDGGRKAEIRNLKLEIRNKSENPEEERSAGELPTFPVSPSGLFRISGFRFRISPFDLTLLVFTTGAVSMAMSVLLMYMYQAAYGAIFLDVGLLAALFMLGLAAGSGVSEKVEGGRWRVEGAEKKVGGGRWKVEGKNSPGFTPASRNLALLPFVLVAHVLFLFAIGWLSPAPARLSFSILFLVSGLLGGVYLPLAAVGLKRAGFTDARAGSALDFADHVGAAAGGLLSGLVLLPLFGGQATLWVLAALVALNLPALWIRAPQDRPAGEGAATDRWVRPAAYALTGTALFLLLASALMNRAGTVRVETLLAGAVRSMAGGGEYARKSGDVPGGSVIYFVGGNPTNGLQSYGFSTEPLAPGVRGYAGPLVLGVLTDPEGALQGVEVLRSRETPAYLAALRDWLRGLKGRSVFKPEGLDGIDAVTGATLSSRAILETLRRAGPAFASQVLGRPVGPGVMPQGGTRVDLPAITLLAFLCAALYLRRRPRPLLRRLFLFAGAVVCGWWFNLQYSLAHVLGVASGMLPAAGLNAAFLLGVVLPLLVILFGNFYCGWLCPFGALQELIGGMFRSKTRPVDPHVGPALVAGQSVWRPPSSGFAQKLRRDESGGPTRLVSVPPWARRMKCAILFAIGVWFSLSRCDGLASADPLVTVFGGQRGLLVTALILLVLGASFFFDRLWCRALCPAGAFLSLLNGAKLLRRGSPKISPANCMYGVESTRELDCIGCDRCRMAQAGAASRRKPGSPSLAYGAVLVVAALLFFGAARQAYESFRNESAAQSEGAGRMRTVDMKKLNGLIQEHRLSDREAMYWKGR